MHIVSERTLCVAARQLRNARLAAFVDLKVTLLEVEEHKQGLLLVQVRGEAQALRSEMETQRNRATQLEQLFQQQVKFAAALMRMQICSPCHFSSPSNMLVISSRTAALCSTVMSFVLCCIDMYTNVVISLLAAWPDLL